MPIKNILKKIFLTIAIFICSILLLAYIITMASLGQADGKGGAGTLQYTCGDNWHGHPFTCTFVESFKGSVWTALFISVMIVSLPFILIYKFYFIFIPAVIIFWIYRKKYYKKRNSPDTQETHYEK